ncbi:hypothetical protein TrRE_jg7963, partial [Triparma retinervis]
EGSDGAEVQAVPLGHSEDRGVVVKSWEESSEPTGDSTMSLSCDSNGGPACTIAMKSVLIEELQDDTPYTHVLVLTFNADVDLDKAEANIVGREQVLSLFTFNPPPTPLDDVGAEPVWKSRDVLHLPIKGSIVEAAFDGTLSITLSLPPPPPSKSKFIDVASTLSLRISEPGRYFLRLISSESSDFTATTEPFNIIDCDESGSAPSELIWPSSASSSSTQEHLAATIQTPSPPLFRVPSKISLPGNRPFVIPSSKIPTSSSPITLSFWVWFGEPGDGQGAHRTLFYKGDPEAKTQDRTPSAFFAPVSAQHDTLVPLDHPRGQESEATSPPPNPLLLQLSTVNEGEAGSESKRGIVAGRFNHLAFTIADGTYSLYIDGDLDSKLHFDGPVLHNDHGMMLGHAPGMDGPRMVVSDLKVWGAELPPDEIKKIRNREASRHSSLGAFDTVSSMNALNPSRHAQRRLASPPPGVPQKHIQSTHVSALTALSALREGDCGGDVRERLALLEEAANCGGAKAALMAAEIYLYGTERENLLRKDSSSSPCATLGLADRDVRKAMKYLELASAGGDVEAMYRMSLLLSSGVGIGGVDKIGGMERLGAAGNVAETDREVGGWRGQGEEGEDFGITIMQPPLSTPLATREAISSLALDLLHLAAGDGHVNAALILAHRYSKGYGVKKDDEAAAYYLRISSDAASEYYHRPGNQPMHEYHRLRVGHEADLVKGEQGEDDEQLQYTILMAEKGDVVAMANYASMLYWGVRGFERDHVKALDFWNRAAELGNVNALCGAASMYVRGEGMDEPDIKKAVEYYEKAAEMGSATAMNGLGYAYFLGQGGMEEDKEKAFGYFLQAAELEQDADSLTNAAHCYSNGHGVEKDEYKAAVLYDKAATMFGNFAAAVEMGRRFHEGGRGVVRDPSQSINYLMSASRAGDTGELVRKGFDLYMEGDYDAAFKVYVEAAELGYEVGANNAAYLLDVGKASISSGGEVGGEVDAEGEGEEEGEGEGRGRGLIAHNTASAEPRDDLLNKAASLRFHWMASEENNAESFAAIGDSFYYGIAKDGSSDVDLDKAFWWYSKAGREGSVKGAYYTAWMQEYYKGDLEAAGRQYERVLRMITVEEGGMELMLLVKFNMWRVKHKMGWAWKAYESARGALFGRGGEGGVGGGFREGLPKLPIERGGEERGGGGKGRGEGGGDEGGDAGEKKDWITVLSSAITKARFLFKGLFLKHRGTVFGLNQSENLGNDILWGNVCIAACVVLLAVNLFRLALMAMGGGGGGVGVRQG